MKWKNSDYIELLDKLIARYGAKLDYNQLLNNLQSRYDIVAADRRKNGQESIYSVDYAIDLNDLINKIKNRLANSEKYENTLNYIHNGTKDFKVKDRPEYDKDFINTTDTSIFKNASTSLHKYFSNRIKAEIDNIQLKIINADDIPEEIKAEAKALISKLHDLTASLSTHTLSQTGYVVSPEKLSAINNTMIQVFDLGIRTGLLYADITQNYRRSGTKSYTSGKKGNKTKISNKNNKATKLESLLDNPPEKYIKELKEYKNYDRDAFNIELCKILKEYYNIDIASTTLRNKPYYTIIEKFRKS